MRTLILAKYYGPTNTKGSRIKCTSSYGVTWHHYDYAGRACETAVKEHAAKYNLGTPEPVMHTEYAAFVA